MKHRIRRGVVAALFIVVLSTAASLGLVACDNGTPLPDVYADWMSYVRDDVLYRDVSLPITHNSGTINTSFLGMGDTEWLNCQQGTIYDHLMYGVRSFDLRMTTDANTGELVCSHGTGYGVPLKEVFSDMARFTEAHEGEFITMWVKLYDSNSYSYAEPEKVREAFEILEPDKYFMDDSYDLDKMSMGEIRESGKRYAVMCPEEWCDYVNPTCIFPRTYDYNYNSGEIEKGEACYDHMWECLVNADESERIRVSLQRGAGGIIGNVTPFEFMQYDREFFLELMNKIAADEHAMTVFAGACIDFATYDYIQVGRVLEFNALKGLVEDPDSFLKLIRERYSWPPVDLDGRAE